MRRTQKTTCLRSIFCAMVTSGASAAPGVHGIRCCGKSANIRANKASKTQVPPEARSGCWEPQPGTLSKSPAGAFAAPPAAVPCCSSPLSHRKRKRLLHRLSPLCNSLLYISLSSADFGRVRPIQGRTLFLAMLHHFPRAASGILRQHGSGSDAAHPGIVPVFCAGMPYKHARMQCHFPAYCPILSA